jgi:hypothetical protein
MMARGGKRPGAGGTKKSKWINLDMANKLELVEGWARDGATDEFIFETLGVSRQTFYVWKGKYPEFAEALRKGKEIIDRKVENALLKRALGYKYDEVTQEPQPVIDERGNVKRDEWDRPIMEMQPVKRVTKEVHPEVVAAIFWLKNRKPDVWRDRKQIDANLNHNGFDYLSDAEIKAELEKLDGDE